MSTIRGTIRDGKVVLATVPNWPEGTEVEVARAPLGEGIGVSEEEQGDDPESIARWLVAFDAIPVAAASPFDDPAVIAWREAMRRHNIEAVREQMEGNSE